jgi:lipopolysaccharide assembly protein A
MRFLKTIFWILILVAIILFSARNWTPVTVTLWGGLVLDTVLPVITLAAFLLGLLPAFILHKATRWSLNRKLESAHRSISEMSAPATPSVFTPEPPPEYAPISGAS